VRGNPFRSARCGAPRDLPKRGLVFALPDKNNFCFWFEHGIIKLLKLINLVKGILFDKNRILQGAGNWLTSTINLLLSSPF